MIRVIFCFFILSFSNLFSQKNIVNLDSIIKVDNYKVYKDLSYGNHERNVLDLWISNSKINTPLMIYIHGGGFGSGSKESAYRKNNFNRIKKFIENGISFATINYRFKNNDDGILVSLNDAKRALQFLRHKSDQFRIDKSKIGVMGSSAGATSSLWLGFFDDMAQLNSDDPIERESTRVSLVVGIAAAHTMDLNKWKEMLNIDQDYMDKLVSQYIGKLDRKKWMDKTLQNEYISKIDFFDEMDKNDPPFFIVNYGGNRKPKNIADFNHNPMHAKILKNRGDSLKIKNVVYATGIGIIDKSSQGLNAFIIENLK